MGCTTSSDDGLRDASDLDPEIMSKRRKANVAAEYDLFGGKDIGAGMTGTVRRVQHRKTHKWYAIKTIFLNRVDEELLKQLRSEISFLAKLDHPNICKLHEVYETSLCVYLVMELLEGGELFDRLKAVKKFPEPVARSLARDMFTAVRYMHSKGICHRDLKLENFVFVDSRPDAPLKLIDFGLSKLFVGPGGDGGDDSDLRRMHSHVGTPYYMAPEVIRGSYTQKCDAWSLGVLLYMLLSGKAPFSGQEAAIERRILTGKVPFRDEHWAPLSPEARELVSSLLQKSPAARLSVSEALQHAWFRGPTAAPAVSLGASPGGADSPGAPRTAPSGGSGDATAADGAAFDAEMVDAMAEFGAFPRLKRAALLLMARELPQSEIEDLQRLFAGVDVHATGRITLDEFAAALRRSGIGEERAAELFRGIDQDESGRVQYSEFLAALAAHRVQLDKQHVADAFSRMDVGGSGRIDAADLRALLGSRFSDAEVAAVVAEVDAEGAGSVSFEAFFAAMTGRIERRAAAAAPPAPRGDGDGDGDGGGGGDRVGDDHGSEGDGDSSGDSGAKGGDSRGGDGE